MRKGGRVVYAGIHMSDIPGFLYADLWGERHILSVANLTREDGVCFLEVPTQAGIRPVVTCFPLRPLVPVIGRAASEIARGKTRTLKETGVAILALAGGKPGPIGFLSPAHA